MSYENRREQFQAPTIFERFVGHLHIDIPLLVGLLLISLLSFVVLYSAGNQDMGLLLRQGCKGWFGIPVNDWVGTH